MNSREEMKRQLMATFRGEMDDHLSTLERNLLHLEEQPGSDESTGLLEEALRAAHSLKGAAQALDIAEVASIAHGLEDVLGALKRGELEVTGTLCDTVLAAVDTLPRSFEAHLRGEELPAEELEALLRSLRAALDGGAGPADDPVKAPKPAAPPLDPVLPLSADLVEERSQRAGARQSTEETLRVTTSKVDRLMAGMGELLVARMRTEQRLEELAALNERMARWQKSWRQVRAYFTRLKRQGEDHGFGPLLDFLATTDENLKNVGADLNVVANSFANDQGHLALLTDDLQERVRVMRMVPIANLFDLFPRMVRDLARSRGKRITLKVEGADTEIDRQLLEAIKDPLTHLLRNAIDHGIEAPERRLELDKPEVGEISLKAAQTGSSIVVEVADDGAGIDIEAVRASAIERGLLHESETASLTEREIMELIFRSGLSTRTETTDLSGRGVGMDVVRENLERLHGLIRVDSERDKGTTFSLTMPLTLATSHVFLVDVAGETVSVPTTTVERILRVDPKKVGSVEGKPAIQVNGRPLPLVSLASMLELPGGDAPLQSGEKMPVVVLGIADRRLAFRVDDLRGTQNVVIKSLGTQLKRVRNVAGASILGSGEVVMILNVADLMSSAQAGQATSAQTEVAADSQRRRRVLLADDSITTRTLERNILETAGYQVLVAADGKAAWAIVQSEPVDILVSDVDMPQMTGLELTKAIKGDDRFRDLPVILVSSLDSPQDKIRGMEAGGDAYITKGTFDQGTLLETIERLIG